MAAYFKIFSAALLGAAVPVAGALLYLESIEPGADRSRAVAPIPPGTWSAEGANPSAMRPGPQIGRAPSALNSVPARKPLDEMQSRELRAQEATADWAFWMAVIAALQLGASIFGIIFVARTLHEAQASTSESRKANETAQRNLAITHEQQRAWIKASLEEINISKYETELRVTAILVCKNVGQTPALNVRTRVKSFNSVHPETFAGSQSQFEDFLDVSLDTLDDYNDTIMPGETEFYPHNFDIPISEIHRYLACSSRNDEFCPVFAASVVYNIVGSVDLRQSSAHAIYADYPDGRSFGWIKWIGFDPSDYELKTGLRDRVT